MKKNKLIIIISIIILFIISIINLYNAKYLNSYYDNYYLKQIIWYLISFLILYILNKNKIDIIYYSKYLYFINIILLIYVLLFSKAINGSRSWINLSFFSLEPSEIMKISLCLFLISIKNSNTTKKIKIFKMIFYTLIPSLLVYLQPDTGAIIFYLIILFSFLIYSKPKYVLLIILLGIISIFSIFYLYKNNTDLLIKIFGNNIFYRIERVINFKNDNYQLYLSMISIYSTSFIRNGFNNILIYIPEATTDFIFSFCVGNFGIIIIPIILICYFLIIYNISKLKNNKTNYLVISFILMLFIQIMINILMNIGLIPIIGITLPFLSYGGSSLLTYFIYIGLIFYYFKMV